MAKKETKLKIQDFKEDVRLATTEDENNLKEALGTVLEQTKQHAANKEEIDNKPVLIEKVAHNVDTLLNRAMIIYVTDFEEATFKELILDIGEYLHVQKTFHINLDESMETGDIYSLIDTMVLSGTQYIDSNCATFTHTKLTNQYSMDMYYYDKSSNKTLCNIKKVHTNNLMCILQAVLHLSKHSHRITNSGDYTNI